MNCLDYLDVSSILEKIPENINVLIYPNLGYTYDVNTKKYEFIPNPEQFSTELKKWLKFSNVRAVGGCCLTTPETIKLIKEEIDRGERESIL